MEFSVCVTGKLRPGFKAKAVQKDFSELFNLTDKKVLKNIFSAASPVLIRKGLSLPEAEQYRQKLHGIGMEAMIIDEEGQPLQKVVSAAAGGASSSANTENSSESSVVFYEDDAQGGEGPTTGTLSIESSSITAAFSWLSDGFSLFKNAPMFWVGCTFLWGIVSIILQIIPVIGSLISSIFSGIMYAFLMLAAYRVSHDEELSFAAVKEDLKPNMMAVGILNILYGIIVAAVGFAAFAMAGDNYMMGIGITVAVMILAGMAFYFAPMLIAVNHLPIPEALKLSLMACIKNILPLILFGVLAILLSIIGMLPLGLGLLVVMPLLVLATYQAYSEIFVSQ